jgi:site-specific recombinase XerD
MTVKLYLRPRAKKDGTRSIMILVTVSRQRIWINTGHSVLPAQWKNNQVTSKHPNYIKLNNVLADRVREVRDQLLNGNKLSLGKTMDFFAFAMEYIKQFNNEKSIGTYNMQLGKINKISRFMQGKPLPFNEITPEWIRKFKTHLKGLGNSPNTVTGDLKRVRAIYNQAAKEGLISAEKSPFKDMQLKDERTAKIPLSGDEFKLMVEFTGNDRLTLARDVFLFSMYCRGARVGDVLTITCGQVVEKMLVYKTMKTGKLVTCVLPKEALKIYAKYSKGSDEYLFPYMGRPLEGMLKERVKSATAVYNKALADLSKKLGFTRRISSHIARHTWARKAMDAGLNLQQMQNALTHSTPAMTQGYISDISQDELNEANLRIFD